MDKKQRPEIIAIKVHQWIKEWDKVKYDPKARRRQPDPYCYLFTLPASELKALAGIYRRTTENILLRSKDMGIQRRHDKARSDEIYRYIKYGYPWSELNEPKRDSGKFDDLRKPGWLPTAIVVNILKPEDKRRGQGVSEKDLITIDDTNQSTIIKLPPNFTGSKWMPSQLHPIEVIDGQHRLWAFEDGKLDGIFNLPVVAFYGLDISWQAYLFWTINIKPKRINPSLAFDLYPLLRTEDWLEKFEGHAIYRETRAQELTETLWAYPESPWFQHINMLGETKLRQTMVSQAAWIRSLMASYVKSWESKRIKVGGLFGAPLESDEEVLAWSRAQQAAFLILMGQKIRDAFKQCNEPWAKSLKQTGGVELLEQQKDPAFYGAYSLINTDQGIRGMLHVTNDLCYVRSRELNLEEWTGDPASDAPEEEAVNKSMKSLKEQKVAKFLRAIAEILARYDWRTSSAPGLSENERTIKAAFRGSGGYKEIRRQLLKLLAKDSGDVGIAAKIVLDALGYD